MDERNRAFIVTEITYTGYGSTRVHHQITVKNATEARHWAINHLDMSNTININELDY